MCNGTLRDSYYVLLQHNKQGEALSNGDAVRAKHLCSVLQAGESSGITWLGVDCLSLSHITFHRKTDTDKHVFSELLCARREEAC